MRHTHTWSHPGQRGEERALPVQQVSRRQLQVDEVSGAECGSVYDQADPTVPGTTGVGLPHQPVFTCSYNTRAKGGRTVGDGRKTPQCTNRHLGHLSLVTWLSLELPQPPYQPPQPGGSRWGIWATPNPLWPPSLISCTHDHHLHQGPQGRERGLVGSPGTGQQTDSTFHIFPVKM